MTVKTRKKQGRKTASLMPIELPPTTRRKELGGNRALEVGGNRRFSEDELEVLSPSFEAIELAKLLGKSAEWLNDYRLAARPKPFQLSDEQRETLKQLKRAETNPTKREDLDRAFRREAREQHEGRLRECRKNAKAWLRVVHHYKLNREWLQQFPENIRARYCRQMVKGVLRASTIELMSENRAEERRRKRERKANRRAAKYLHKQFGHRKFRRPIPVRPNGEIDFRLAAERDFLSMTARGHETGISKVQEQDQWSVTEDLRIAKRLSDEQQVFWKKRKSRAI